MNTNETIKRRRSMNKRMGMNTSGTIYKKEKYEQEDGHEHKGSK